MADRENILRRVGNALAPLSKRAALPDYDVEDFVLKGAFTSSDLWEVFCARTRLVNGLGLNDPALLAKHLLEAGQLKGYCAPDLWPQLKRFFGSGFSVATEFDRGRVDDYAFGITRAAGAIAESGTVILSDEATPRLPALTPWVHVAAVHRENLYRDIPSAIAALGEDPNVIWCTGPSKTADVEGILIEGVHGPGEQIVLLLG